MSYDDIDDWFYADSDDDDIRTFDPEAAYRKFSRESDFDDDEEWVDPDEDDIDLSDIEEIEEEELENVDDSDFYESD